MAEPYFGAQSFTSCAERNKDAKPRLYFEHDVPSVLGSQFGRCSSQWQHRFRLRKSELCTGSTKPIRNKKTAQSVENACGKAHDFPVGFAIQQNVLQNVFYVEE